MKKSLFDQFLNEALSVPFDINKKQKPKSSFKDLNESVFGNDVSNISPKDVLKDLDKSLFWPPEARDVSETFSYDDEEGTTGMFQFCLKCAENYPSPKSICVTFWFTLDETPNGGVALMCNTCDVDAGRDVPAEDSRYLHATAKEVKDHPFTTKQQVVDYINQVLKTVTQEYNEIMKEDE